jgi:hypothetical protein
MINKLFRTFRFWIRIGFDGKPTAVTRVLLKPGNPWQQSGKIEVEALLGPDIVEIAKVKGPVDLIVAMCKVSDKLDNPSGELVLQGVRPADGTLSMTELDATADEVVKLTLEMDYDRLTFAFGILDKLAAAVS